MKKPDYEKFFKVCDEDENDIDTLRAWLKLKRSRMENCILSNRTVTPTYSCLILKIKQIRIIASCQRKNIASWIFALDRKFFIYVKTKNNAK